jgi:hypothetical protein
VEPTLEVAISEPAPVMVEPSVASVAPITPIAAPTPSVFSRRASETAGTKAEPKLSFAGVAKELLPAAASVPTIEPAVSIPRASVEEITRAALDELVGATDKRETDDRSAAFAKPSGAFSKASAQKRPRTIAPPPAEGAPIAGATKLGTAPRRAATPAAGTESAPPASEADAAQAVHSIEGLQFPNDGVLTRQWMEFLNQMAAGK